MAEKYDFSGWATRNDLKCADGRTIRRDAFRDNDGETVPLVYSHIHTDVGNVLGHALLENRPEGVYVYGSFNDTPQGENAKCQVRHGDITKLSIYANQLTQNGGDVLHGSIKEVSLVLAGANPGAYIDVPYIEHSDTEADEAIIYTPDEFTLELSHADKKRKEFYEDDEEEEEDDIEEEDDEEEDLDDEEDEEEEDEDDEEEKKHMKHSDTDTGAQEMSVDDVRAVIDSMTDEQKEVMYGLIGQAVEDAESGSKKKEDEEEMKHNVFDNDVAPENVLSHSDMETIFRDAKRLGSLKESVEEHLDNGVLAHAVYNTAANGGQGSEQTYGIADIDWLFPDYKEINNPPEFIKREQDWVTVVMNGVHHTPFSRIKSTFANITMDEARAKGYIKGNRKKDEVFSLLKRATDPQTVYKKQKLDRDDIIDITDFDVVAWLKAEMRFMLDEELARAILIGDGRQNSDDDKISDDHIRPIATDDELFAIKINVAEADSNSTDPEGDFAKNFIRAAIKSRKDYKGSGNPTLFTTEDMLADMLLIEDGIGHLLYADEAALARTLRVTKIVTVPVMEGNDTFAIIVNLNDYNVGADKGGAVSMFEDFDIDFNQQKYLIETRCSGALIKPYSAMVFSKGKGGSASS